MAARFVTRSYFAIRAHPHLYEINTWAWLEQLSARLGRRITLADVPDAEWDSLAELGFNIVWLMGVWQRSPESRRIKLENPQNHPEFEAALPGWTPSDAIGSPYSIVDYVPDPRIGTWDSLDAVRKKLHTRGMALFLDFVGNHTALDSPWTREHPEFYIQGTKEQIRSESIGLLSDRDNRWRQISSLRKGSLLPALGRRRTVKSFPARSARRTT
jgi:hypothetical protein